jgi:hypothetical protein
MDERFQHRFCLSQAKQRVMHIRSFHNHWSPTCSKVLFPIDSFLCFWRHRHVSCASQIWLEDQTARGWTTMRKIIQEDAHAGGVSCVQHTSVCHLFLVSLVFSHSIAHSTAEELVAWCLMHAYGSDNVLPLPDSVCDRS